LNRRDKADKSGKSSVPDDPQREAHKISETDLETGFDPEVLSSLQERVSQARKPQISETETRGRGSAIGMAYRLSMELVVGIVVGGFIGWWLDKWLSTKPIFLLVMLLLGMIAGVVNMLRTARDMRQVLGVDDTPVSDVKTQVTTETKSDTEEFSDGS